MKKLNSENNEILRRHSGNLKMKITENTKKINNKKDNLKNKTVVRSVRETEV